jgi:predicted RND superfamily exporter protein
VERETGGAVQVHIIGFAKVMGDIGDGARGVLILFGVSIVITTLLVWNYAGRWKLAGAPILCSLIAVVWQVGLITALGYGIDPLSLLVPFLAFAIGVSHGVQMVRAFRTAVFSGCDTSLSAAKNAFKQLLIPGGVALLADTVGFLTILVIKIQSIRELGIAASLGVCVIIVTNLFLLPIILSSLQLPGLTTNGSRNAARAPTASGRASPAR